MKPYILGNAEVVLRLLLPPRTATDDLTTWAAVAATSGRAEPIEAGTSWTRLTEIDGAGAERPDEFEHPGGRTSDALLGELVGALTAATGPEVPWHYQENSDRTGVQVELVPTEHLGAKRQRAYGPAALDGPLSELAEQWADHGFHGRAWDDNTMVSLAADSYADSIILSGPARLASMLATTNLEVFRLAASAANPMTTN